METCYSDDAIGDFTSTLQGHGHLRIHRRKTHKCNGKSRAGAIVQGGRTGHARPSVSRRDVSQLWRTRLDATTNWAVATTGIALSVAFSNAGNSPLPLVLAHARLMEVSMYGPLLRLEGVRVDNGWNEALARDYERLHFHISFWEATGRRLRRNYSFLFAVQAVSYVV